MTPLASLRRRRLANNVRLAAASGATDPYFANVRFLSNYTSDASDVKGHPVTLYGNAAVSGGALVLDGNGDFASTPDSADLKGGTSALTLEAWITPTSLTGIAIIAGQISWGNQTAFIIYRDGTSFKVYAENTSPGTMVLITGGTLALNTKQYVSCSRSATNVWSAYVGATRGAQVTGTGTTIRSIPDNWTVGASANAVNFFTGSIHAVRYSVGTDRGYGGATITVPDDPFPEA